MICCGTCGARNFKAEREIGPGDGIDWKAVAVALCVKYGTREGQALIGSGTLQWAASRVRFVVERDGDALALRWEAPALKPEGV